MSCDSSLELNEFVHSTSYKDVHTPSIAHAVEDFRNVHATK